MLLLDLPPEVFLRITTIYVTTVSARQAARTREVCRVFCDYINEELFARQPAGKFKARAAKNLLRNNLRLFLRYRMISLNGAPQFLPDLIRALAGRMSQLFGPPKPALRNRAIDGIIGFIIKNRTPHAVNLAIAPTQCQQQDLTGARLDHIVLAIAVGSRAAAAVRLVLRAGVDPWGQSALFGCSINIAAELNEWKLMKMLLLATKKSDVGEISESRQKLQFRLITNAIDDATRKGHWNLAIIMLQWSGVHCTKPPLSTVRVWMKRAVQSDNLDFLKDIRALGFIRHSLKKYRHDIASGLSTNPNPESTLRFCVRAGIFNENDTFPLLVDDNSSQHLLNVAVCTSSLPLARAAIAINAYGDRPAALRTAIQKNDAAMVRFLLDSGVDPEAIMHSPVERTTCELAQPGSEIYIMIKSAIQQKIQQQGANYHAPHQIVRRGYKCEDVLVAYTFHPPKPKVTLD